MKSFHWNSRRVVAKIGLRGHQHTEIELNFVETGRLVYQRGTEQISMNSGETTLFWAALPHQIIHVEPKTILNWLTLPLSTFLTWDLPSSMVDTLMDGQMLPFHDVEIRKRCEIFFASWHQEINANSLTRQKVAMGEVQALLHRLSLHLSGTTHNIQSAPSGKAHQIARFIQNNYTTLLGVEHIAQAVNLNPNYAMTLFRQHYAMSILDYLTRFRVAHAQRLLLFEEMPIPEVAHQSGFGSVSQFYATFKQIVGTTPRRYRHQK